jgi:8-oxo-dGTP pyrophosphatase MutT (NUDIX family)
MYFEQKIYINNKPLILTNIGEQYIQQHPVAPGYLFLSGAFRRNLIMAQQHLERHLSIGAIIEDISVASLQQMLAETYTIIEAGGGVVENEDGDVLMIYRRGKWDLPKGKRDDGESIIECARREVMEETGLDQLDVGEKITETYHVYSQGAKDLLKQTYWFEMKAAKSAKLQPQQAENILEAKWIPEKKLGLYMHQSYDAIREVLLKRGKSWK